jgi:hypothetical protein
VSQPVFEAQADRRLLPGGPAATRYVLVRLVAPVREGHERLPLNLAFVLDAGLAIAFVPLQLADSWFSHWHADRSTAVVSTFGWEQTAGVPLAAFVAYELLHHGLRRLGPRYQPEDWAHQDTRGCLFDFCALKPEIEIKLQTAALCDECWKRLLDIGAPMESLERLLDVLRELAHAAPSLPSPGPLAAHP